MLTERMIPWLYFRLVVILGFFIFVTIKGMTLISLITVGLFVLTALQLRTAYTSKKLATAPAVTPTTFVTVTLIGKVWTSFLAGANLSQLSDNVHYVK